MRMWNIKPKFLCKKHLIGEHFEMHMFVGSINKNISMKGYIENGMLEVHNLTRRHNQLVKEMESRGYTHNSPLQKYKKWRAGKVNVEKNMKEIVRRCPDCKKLIKTKNNEKRKEKKKLYSI